MHIEDIVVVIIHAMIVELKSNQDLRTADFCLWIIGFSLFITLHQSYFRLLTITPYAQNLEKIILS